MAKTKQETNQLEIQKEKHQSNTLSKSLMNLSNYMETETSKMTKQ